MDISDGLLKGKTRKTIVHSSRGKAAPGEILAVMGPSGAGKTSLFNALAKRGRGYITSGEATLNGVPYNKNDLIHLLRKHINPFGRYHFDLDRIQKPQGGSGENP